MTYSRSVHPEAEEELLDAIRHYEERAGVGGDFAARISHASHDIQDSPEAWPPVASWSGPPLIRSRRVGAYPYRIVYFRRNDEVVIIAYAHERRRVDYWAHRTRPI